jgi:hypothetical protein
VANRPTAAYHSADLYRTVSQQFGSAPVIVERPPGEILDVEVKASATVRAADFRGLLHMREQSVAVAKSEGEGDDQAFVDAVSCGLEDDDEAASPA